MPKCVIVFYLVACVLFTFLVLSVLNEGIKFFQNPRVIEVICYDVNMN